MKKLFFILFLTLIISSVLPAQQMTDDTDIHGNSRPEAAAVLPALSPTDGGNAWTPVGPFGGDVLDIAVDPANTGLVYLAAGYPYMRTSEDEPWTLINALLSLSPGGIQCIETNSDGVVFAGSSSTFGKILKSEDQGATWQNVFTSVNTGTLNIVIDPGNEMNMYVTTSSNISGTLNKVITMSTDGGSSWTALDMTEHFPIGMGCNDLAVDPENSDVLVALGDGGFSFTSKAIISQDGGVSWEDITTGLPSDRPFNEVTIQNGTIYISGGQLFGGNTMGIYKSDDWGESWQDISFGFPIKVVNDILIDPSDPTLMYAATEGDGIYLSTNGGLTWEYETGGDGDNGSARKILFDPESSAMIYAGYLSLGVCISMNSGQDWESSSIGIASLKLNDIEVDPSNPASILASFEAENSGGCYIFDPFEGDWGLVSSLPATRFSAVSIGIDGAMYAWSNGPTTVAAEGLYRSVDGGETWDNLGPNIGPVFETQIFGIVCSQSDPELIFICGNNFGANGWASMIYRTTDSGESWENVFMGPDMNGFKYISIDPASDDQVVYAAYKTETDGAGFMKSSDGGTTWTTINTGIPESTKWAGAIVADIEDPEILYGGVGGYGGTPGKVYKSVNSGLSWDEMEMSLSNYSKVTDIIQSPGYPEVIYAATTIDGVYMTEDGATWSASNEGLPSGNITAFSRIFENEEETLGFYASTFSSSAFYTELYEPGSVGVPPNATSNDGPGVMPNPSNGHFRIHLGKYAGQSGEFRLSGIDGKQHHQGKVNAEGPTILPVEVDLNPGIYILSIKSTEDCNAVKVIIE